MLNIVLFGAPGAGKGTQSEKLIRQYNLVHVSTGDLLRSEIKNGTPLGLEAKKRMDVGQLVPDEVVIGMIRNKIDENLSGAGFIFDGFPRTVKQAEILDELLSERGQSITAVLCLDVPGEELIKRLVKRGETSGRSDDNEEVAIKRIRIYENETAPVASHYEKQEKRYSIDGIGSVDEIFQRICNMIDSVAVKA
jgi:adenylate kinase